MEQLNSKKLSISVSEKHGENNLVLIDEFSVNSGSHVKIKPQMYSLLQSCKFLQTGGINFEITLGNSLILKYMDSFLEEDEISRSIPIMILLKNANNLFEVQFLIDDGFSKDIKNISNALTEDFEGEDIHTVIDYILEKADIFKNSGLITLIDTDERTLNFLEDSLNEKFLFYGISK